MGGLMGGGCFGRCKLPLVATWPPGGAGALFLGLPIVEADSVLTGGSGVLSPPDTPPPRTLKL